MKNIAVLGSTGSIGTQTLELVRRYPDRFRAVGLCAKKNAELLLKQILEFKPLLAAIEDEDAYRSIASLVPPETRLISGKNAMLEVAGMEEADVDVVAVVGIAGLPAVMEGLKKKKKIALANKEALVTGGQLVSDAVRRNGDILYPVDSEHSAIFQCLQGRADNAIKRILLTASGGPFRTMDKVELSRVTPADALKHPTWSMGKKITIDCATLMNKGLEVIEACWLFGVPAEKVKPVIHPQSIVHSAVEFEDGAVLAQLGMPDMKLPILYALEYPKRLDSGAPRLDLTSVGKLEFFEPDLEKFPCLALAFRAMSMGGNAPCALNAANEVAVDLFLREKIGFCDIPKLIEHTIGTMSVIPHPSIEDIYATDREVRAKLSQGGNDPNRA